MIEKIVLFNQGGIVSLIGNIICWFIQPWCSIKHTEYVIALIFLLICTEYTGIIAYLMLTQPRLLLDVSYTGVLRQYHNEWVMVASIFHYALCDVGVAFTLSRIIFANWRRPTKMGYICIFVFAFLSFFWSPISVLAVGLVMLTPQKWYTRVR